MGEKLGSNAGDGGVERNDYQQQAANAFEAYERNLEASELSEGLTTLKPAEDTLSTLPFLHTSVSHSEGVVDWKNGQLLLEEWATTIMGAHTESMNFTRYFEVKDFPGAKPDFPVNVFLNIHVNVEGGYAEMNLAFQASSESYQVYTLTQFLEKDDVTGAKSNVPSSFLHFIDETIEKEKARRLTADGGENEFVAHN